MRTKRILSVMLAFVMVISMMAVHTITAGAIATDATPVCVDETYDRVEFVSSVTTFSDEEQDGNLWYFYTTDETKLKVVNCYIEEDAVEGDKLHVFLKGIAVGNGLEILCKQYDAESTSWVDGVSAINGIYNVVPAPVYLDLDASTTEILDNKELDQNYNLTVEDGDKTNATKVKLSWEIKDINATRTDNKVWNTTELCWETSTSSTEITQEGTAKFTLENYSSEKVNATVTFDTAEYATGKKFTAPTLVFDEDKNENTTDDGVITLDTANGNSTYSKENPPKGEIDVTVTPDTDDFKSLSATSSAAKYGTYTVTLSKAEYSITIDESILSICSLDSGCPTKIAPNGSATLTFTTKYEGESYCDLHAYNVTVANADCEGNNWVVSEYGETATLTISNPTGDVTVSESECLAKGTKITMADGSLKDIEDITVGEKILTFNHESGKYEAQEVNLAYAGEKKDFGTELTFSDGTTLTIVGEHDLFEKESMKYVTLTRANAKANIGKHYYNAETGKFAELTGVNTTAPVNYYSLYTKYNYNCIANGMLTVPDDVDYMLNIYQFNADLTANEAQLQKDIATYGIYEYRSDAPYSKAEYDMMNMKYINIVVGKKLATFEELFGARDEYLELK